MSKETTQSLIAVLVPFSAALFLYVLLSHVVVPLWRSQSANLPIDTMSESCSRVKTKLSGWMSKMRRRGEEEWDEDAGEEETEGMLGYDEVERRRFGSAV